MSFFLHPLTLANELIIQFKRVLMAPPMLLEIAFTMDPCIVVLSLLSRAAAASHER